MSAAPRTTSQRKADTLAQLRTPVLDGWVASAGLVDGSARAHLVPLSLAWIDERVVISLDAGSVTARNIVEERSARLGTGQTRDVVMIDARVDQVVAVADAPQALGDGFTAQADWDPRTADGYIYIVLRPQRIQAWRNVDEEPGRTIMREAPGSVTDLAAAYNGDGGMNNHVTALDVDTGVLARDQSRRRSTGSIHPSLIWCGRSSAVAVALTTDMRLQV